MAYDVAAILKIVGSSLDDAALAAKRMVATSLDDVGTSAKVATAKSAGVVIDDTAAMPQYAHGLSPERELPVVAKITLLSLLNKAILIPLALALSVWAPWSIPPLLALGGAFLCFEGVEGIIEKFWGGVHESADDTNLSPAEAEKARVSNAAKTDFVLSAEIVVISLSTMAAAPLAQKALALVLAGFLMTVGVYGVVALIVKMDDVGLACVRRGVARGNAALQRLGTGIVSMMPAVLTGLSYLGTVAMLAVGGGILAHHVPAVAAVAHGGGALAGAIELALGTLLGAVAGGVLVAIAHLVHRLRRKH
jgi:hypothetical protein